MGNRRRRQAVNAGGIVHFDSAPAYEFALGHLKGRWTTLGEAAGCITVVVRRIQLSAMARAEQLDDWDGE